MSNTYEKASDSVAKGLVEEGTRLIEVAAIGSTLIRGLMAISVDAQGKSNAPFLFSAVSFLKLDAPIWCTVLIIVAFTHLLLFAFGYRYSLHGLRYTGVAIQSFLWAFMGTAVYFSNESKIVSMSYYWPSMLFAWAFLALYAQSKFRKNLRAKGVIK